MLKSIRFRPEITLNEVNVVEMKDVPNQTFYETINFWCKSFPVKSIRTWDRF